MRKKKKYFSNILQSFASKDGIDFVQEILFLPLPFKNKRVGERVKRTNSQRKNIKVERIGERERETNEKK